MKPRNGQPDPASAAPDPAAEDAGIRRRIAFSFARQGLMRSLGAVLGRVAPGEVEIALTPMPGISRQHGFVHARAVSAIADSAAGYAPSA